MLHHIIFEIRTEWKEFTHSKYRRIVGNLWRRLLLFRGTRRCDDRKLFDIASPKDDIWVDLIGAGYLFGRIAFSA